MMFSHSILVKVASVLAVANLLASAVDVPFGEPLYKCTVENTFALTFDDGPSKTLTPKLLDTLKLHDFKATFFVNGENTGILANEGALLKRMIDEGHQIASHAYEHVSLSEQAQISEDNMRSQMTKLDDVLIAKIGKAPTFMRPPMFEASDKVLKILKDMEYHVVITEVDTKDYVNNTPETYGNSLRTLQKGVEKGTIVLMHDIYSTTVNRIVPEAVPALLKSGKKFVTVGECLGLPENQWYREKSVNGKASPNPPNTTGPSPSGKAIDMTKAHNSIVKVQPSGVVSVFSAAPSAAAPTTADAKQADACVGDNCASVITGTATTMGVSAAAVLLGVFAAMI